MDTLKRNRATLPSIWGSLLDDRWAAAPSATRRVAQLPAVNIKSTDNAYEVHLAAPGLVKTDFDVQVDDDILTISAEHKVSTEGEKEQYTRREFAYGTFKRSFSLPEDANSEEVSAHYENGVLRLAIPKKAQESAKKARAIEVA